MRCAAQRIVVDRPLPGPDFVDLGADADHGLAEGVHFGQALALGGLHHERTGHRKTHRWCVKTIVCQPFCDIVDGDTGQLSDTAQVQDALVGDHAVLAGVQHRVILVKAARNVVSRRDRCQRCRPQSLSPHHPDVCPGDRKNRSRPIWCRRHRIALGQLGGEGVTWQKRCQVRPHRHRADAWATAAVRNAECLV
ncbi:Uncharacterised protein [Mycobacterium tuberculosis]|uniref:Uncharacterized protein n=1 Tax=Mycobacterium tuberculosis TaxID=1773 RepID=A0A655CIU8_MYCTX|nr:Uncharacterised protein [Mycobacterium tuberculosis]CKS77477.1 Uncharacterised protein [Mycobacterium tuberculosis]CNU16651.1 Uncharacterised protein [Mycobacterium tuberculosis]